MFHVLQGKGKKSDHSLLFILLAQLTFILFIKRIVLCKSDISKENRVVLFDSLVAHFRAKDLMKCCFKKIKKRETNEPCKKKKLF